MRNLAETLVMLPTEHSELSGVANLIFFPLQYRNGEQTELSHNLLEHPFPSSEIPHNKYTNIRKHQLLPHLLG